MELVFDQSWLVLSTTSVDWSATTTEPTRTGPSWFGCGPANLGQLLNWLQSMVAPFWGQKPDWTRPWYTNQNHLECAFFAVTSLGKQSVIMGHSWLQKHNPNINWATGEVKMTCCSRRCCSGCQDEICEEHRAQKFEKSAHLWLFCWRAPGPCPGRWWRWTLWVWHWHWPWNQGQRLNICHRLAPTSRRNSSDFHHLPKVGRSLQVELWPTLTLWQLSSSHGRSSWPSPRVQQSVLQGVIWCLARALTLGPCYRACPWGKTGRLQGLPTLPLWAEGTRCLPKGKFGVWTHLPIQIPDGLSGVLHQEERWQPPTCPGLLCP